MTLSAWRYIQATASGTRKWTSVRASAASRSASMFRRTSEVSVFRRWYASDTVRPSVVTPWFSMTRLFVCSMKSLIGPTSCSTSRCEGTRYGGLAMTLRELKREHPQLLGGAGGEERDGLVVMDVDDRADVGPQAQDLAAQVVADARRHGAVQEPRGRDVGDDDVVERHLLQRHLGMLGIG